MSEGVCESLLRGCEDNLKAKHRCATAVPSPTTLATNDSPTAAMNAIARGSLVSVKQHSSSQIINTSLCPPSKLVAIVAKFSH